MSTVADPANIPLPQLIELLRAWPVTDKKLLAPVELLTGFSGGHIIDNPQTRQFINAFPAHDGYGTPAYATVDWYRLLTGLADGQLFALNQAEQIVVALACSLVVGDLARAGHLFDQPNKALLVRTIAVVFGLGGTSAIVHRMYEAERELAALRATQTGAAQ